MKNQTITIDADKTEAPAQLRQAWSEERAAAPGSLSGRYPAGNTAHPSHTNRFSTDGPSTRTTEASTTRSSLSSQSGSGRRNSLSRIAAEQAYVPISVTIIAVTLLVGPHESMTAGQSFRLGSQPASGDYTRLPQFVSIHS